MLNGPDNQQVFVDHPSPEDAAEREIYSGLLMDLFLLPTYAPPGQLDYELNMSCNPFPFPLEDRPDLEYLPRGQVQLYPADRDYDTGQIQPDLLDARLLHRLIRLG